MMDRPSSLRQGTALQTEVKGCEAEQACWCDDFGEEFNRPLTFMQVFRGPEVWSSLMCIEKGAPTGECIPQAEKPRRIAEWMRAWMARHPKAATWTPNYDSKAERDYLLDSEFAKCVLGEARACYWFASIFQRGTKPDHQKAITFFEYGCRLGDARGCYLEGRGYVRGEGVPRDLRKAARLFRAACDGDAPDACLHLAAIYLGYSKTELEESGHPKEWFFAEMARLTRKGCRGQLWDQTLKSAFCRR